MHKQVKQLVGWFSIARVLLFVLIFSFLLLGLVINRFVEQNKWLENEFTAQIQNVQLNEEIAELSLYIKNAESANRGYVISENPEFVKNFDASINSIRTIYLRIQQLENRKEDQADAALFLKSDSLIHQKIDHMKRVKSLCDNHQYKIAARLIATNIGLHLSDSIAGINKQISDNKHAHLKKSQSGFLKVKSNNNYIVYTGISISLLLIVLSFYFLIIEVKKTRKFSKELLVRKQFYQTTLSSLSEGLITTDKEGNIEYINPAAEQLTGWCWQDAIKQPLHTVFNVVNEETGKPFENIVSRVLQHGTTIGLENNTLLKAKDAGTFIISNNGSPIFDLNGNISGAVLVFNDITEKYRITKQLRDSEEKYRSFIEQASDAILIYSFDGEIHEFNKACYSMLGYTKEEYAKLRLADILVDDIIINQDTYTAILAGETKTLDKKLMRKDGSLLETEFKVRMLAEGKAIAFARDITERKKAEQSIKESEEKYRSLVERAAEGIIVFDQLGNIISVNSSCSKLVGHEKSELTTMNLMDLMPLEYVGKIPVDLSKIYEGSPLLVEKHIKRGDGSIFLAEVSVLLMYDGNIQVIVRDITERKKAEEALQESEETFRKLFTESADPILLLDETGFTECNQAAASILGYSSPQEILIKQPWEISPEKQPDGRLSTEKATEMIAKALRYGNNRFEWIHIKIDRTEFPVEVMLTPIILKGKQLFYTIWRDITERKKAERAIKESEEKYRTLIEQAADSIFINDQQGNILEANDSGSKLLGYTKEELVKMNVKDLYSNEELLARPIMFKELFAGKRTSIERQIQHSNGSEIPVEITSKMLSDGRVMAIIRDITQRKKSEIALAESENQLRTIIQAEPECVKILNSKGELEDMNPAGLAMIEADSIMQVKGKSVLGIINVDYRNAFIHLTNEVFNGNSGKLEFKITGFKGTQRWLETHAVPLKNATGEIKSLLSVTRDITERKNAEEAIIKEKELSDSIINRMPGVFYFYDENLKMLRWNKQFETVTGYSATEIDKKNPAEFFTGVDKEYMKAATIKVFNEGSGSLAASFTTKAGEEIPFYFTGLRILYEGKHCLLGIGIDMTEHKNAELKTKSAIERYDILADATSDTIWDWDIVNNKMLYNEGITKMFGYKAAEVENVVDWWNDKLHSEDFPQVKDALEDVFEKKMERLQLQYRFRCADGSYKNIFDRAFVLFDNDGNPTRMIGAMQDITHEVQEEIRIAKAIIDAQEQERNYLGAELHDNINQILAGSLLTLGIAKSKETDTTQRNGFISSAMGYITDAINETRKLSHSLVPAGFEDNSLKELFETLLLNINVENLFTIRLHFDEFDETVIPENVQINLYRILQEQTKNILKYSEAHIIEVAVKITDNAVRLRIYDNGKGFDTKAKKTGIGLSNIKKRAEVLSGKFILNSTPGNGCELIVEIPLDV